MSIKRFGTYRFFVELDSLTIAEFSEASGLQSEIETFKWQEGGNNGFVYNLPVRTSWSQIVLKRGLADLTFWNWYNDCVNGTFKRRGLSITIYSFTVSGGQAASLRWNVAAALPVKWSGPSLKAGSNELAFETIELSHQGLSLVQGGS